MVLRAKRGGPGLFYYIKFDASLILNPSSSIVYILTVFLHNPNVLSEILRGDTKVADVTDGKYTPGKEDRTGSLRH